MPEPRPCTFTPETLKALLILRTTRSTSSLISHSHTVTTRHEANLRALFFLMSRSSLSSNFLRQKSECDFGNGSAHLGHLCQKHPFTKMATLLFVKTISGRPGTPFLCSLYPLMPALNMAARSVTSGEVFLPLFDFMDFETASELGGGGGPSSFCNRQHQTIRKCAIR